MNQRRMTVMVAGFMLLVFNALIFQKEMLLAQGESVYFELAPVDPRSLMQGDYMQLNYALSRELEALMPDLPGASRGRVVITLDEHHVAKSPRLEGGTLQENERLLKWKRLERGTFGFGVEAFYFQEGRGEHFARAKYAEVKLGKRGGILLVGLLDEDWERL